MIKKTLILLFMLLCSIGCSWAQTKASGTVVDSSGDPIIGASVVVKGSSPLIGTITDIDGVFRIELPVGKDILVFTSIGFQEIQAKATAQMHIVMPNDSKELDEVVVVGYGTQKKVNLTGAIGQIDSKVLESRPITTTTSALQGTIPNLQVTNPSGEPGTGSTLNVRGTTSINGGGPLVLVDGVEMSLDLVNPNDIANVTVLKDAAAASIYGVRAAYGVILVTTKSAGKDMKTTVSYTGNFSFATPSILPEFIGSSWEFAEWMNVACANGKETALFKVEDIAKMKAYAQDPKNNPQYEVIDGQLRYYGFSNLKDAMVKSSSPSQRHNINISGGNEKTKFYTSIGYFNQDGLYKVGEDNFKRINTRLNVENQTTAWMKLGFRTLYNYSTQDKPFTYDNKDVWKRVIYSSPTDFIQPWVKDARYPELDRFAGMYLVDNSLAMLENGGRNKYDEHDMWTTATVDLDILDGWKAHADFNYNIKYRKSSEHSKPLSFFDGSFNETYGRTSNGYYKMTNTNTNYYSFNAYTEYEKTFAEKHYLKAMVGFNQELTKYSTFNGRRDGILNDNIPSLSLGTGNQSVGQDGFEWALRGGFFRLNYIFNNRYLFELNGRYDGTSRFPSDNRFVFLPSFSAAWRISEEAFMAGTRSWLDNLKLRASYGELGNQLISSKDWSGNTKYYPYIPFMSNGTAGYWIFGNEKATTINPGNLTTNSLTWEKVKTANIGIDMTVLDQRLDFSFDYYQRTTSDMLVKAAYPDVLGATAPPANSAELRTSGWELSIKWRDRIGKDFAYDLGFIISDSQAKITKYYNPTGDINTWYEGAKVGEIWGYVTEGIFQSQEEVANSPSQKEVANVEWSEGDIKFKNLNNDEKISSGNNTLKDPGDRKVIGNTTPRYQYGFTVNLTYKNYYLNAFVQGVGKRDFYPELEEFWPAGTQYYNAQKWQVEDSWTPENRNAYFPLVRAKDTRSRVTQTRFLQDASYMRMKNLTLGWNLPNEWIKRVCLSRASIYVSGENLFEFTNVKGPYDPEAAGDKGKMLYPFMRTYSFGVNLTF